MTEREQERSISERKRQENSGGKAADRERYMTKQEFLEMMRLALNGKVSSGLIMENLRYYEDYINIEVRKGRSEEEVLAELGDPRLLARTIAETSGAGDGQSAEYTDRVRHGGSEEYRPRGRARQLYLKVLSRVPLWVWLILLLLIVVVILSVVFSIIGAILPVLLPIVLVLILVKAFRDWIN
ncbi:MAG: DUF1700 domain-containing protein [Lachnospiraceae bacterium]|nr:DUF1700 domain-containing protein [Lachnospiraceae bacterium]